MAAGDPDRHHRGRRELELSALAAEPIDGQKLAIGFLCVGALGAVSLGAATGVEPPSDQTLCPLRLATGIPCPFCGMTHSLLALGRGNLGESVAFSPLGPLVAIVSLLIAWRLSVAVRQRRPLLWRREVLIAGGLALAVSWAYQLLGGGVA